MGTISLQTYAQTSSPFPTMTPSPTLSPSSSVTPSLSPSPTIRPTPSPTPPPPTPPPPTDPCASGPQATINMSINPYPSDYQVSKTPWYVVGKSATRNVSALIKTNLSGPNGTFNGILSVMETATCSATGTWTLESINGSITEYYAYDDPNFYAKYSDFYKQTDDFTFVINFPSQGPTFWLSSWAHTRAAKGHIGGRTQGKLEVSIASSSWTADLDLNHNIAFASHPTFGYPNYSADYLPDDKNYIFKNGIFPKGSAVIQRTVSQALDANGHVGPGPMVLNPSPTGNKNLFLVESSRKGAMLGGLASSEIFTSAFENTYETDKLQTVYLKSSSGHSEISFLLQGFTRNKTDIIFDIVNDDTKLHPVQKRIYPLTVDLQFRDYRLMTPTLNMGLYSRTTLSWGSKTRNFTKTWEPVKLVVSVGQPWDISANSLLPQPPMTEDLKTKLTEFWQKIIARDLDSVLPKTLPPLDVQPY